MKPLLAIIINILPWPLKRWFLQSVFKYKIHPTAKIGLSYVFPDDLTMEANSSIGHLNVIKNLKCISFGEHSTLGRGNWITGFPIHLKSHFQHQPERDPVLRIGKHSAITNRHIIDCTATVTIGDFVTLAGFSSQILTHSIDIENNRQHSTPISIGDYCFVGTNSVLLPGAGLPAYSVLGAKALLNKSYTEKYHLYGGNPAKPIKALSEGSRYFNRNIGLV